MRIHADPDTDPDPDPDPKLWYKRLCEYPRCVFALYKCSILLSQFPFLMEEKNLLYKMSNFWRSCRSFENLYLYVFLLLSSFLTFLRHPSPVLQTVYRYPIFFEEENNGAVVRTASLMCELPIQSIKNTFLFLLFNDVKVSLRRKNKNNMESYFFGPSISRCQLNQFYDTSHNYWCSMHICSVGQKKSHGFILLLLQSLINV